MSTEPSTTKSRVATVLDKVGEELEKLGKSEKVETLVIDYHVNKEIDRRSKALIDGLELRKKQRKELDVLERKTNKTVDGTGAIVSQGYSVQDFETIKKARERVQKLERALETALERQDYNELYKQVSGGGSGNQEQEKPQPSGE